MALFIAGSILISACGGAASTEMNEENQPSPEEKVPETAPETDENTPPVEGIAVALTSDPQKIVFATSDNVKLNGVFDPAGSASAPLVILMHWAPGDQDDWVEIAYWLQNRGMGGNSTVAESTPWLDPSWFPFIEPENSYNVFTFTFRNCENGCKSFEQEN